MMTPQLWKRIEQTPLIQKLMGEDAKSTLKKRQALVATIAEHHQELEKIAPALNAVVEKKIAAAEQAHVMWRERQRESREAIASRSAETDKHTRAIAMAERELRETEDPAIAAFIESIHEELGLTRHSYQARERKFTDPLRNTTHTYVESDVAQLKAYHDRLRLAIRDAEALRLLAVDDVEVALTEIKERM